MAYDKVIDSAVMNADLTSVANAIRSKGGTSASLAFPTGFVNAISAIETGGKVTTEVHDITFASNLGDGANTTKMLLSSNAFVKENCAKDSFAVMLIPVAQVALNTGSIHFAYHGNLNIGATNSVRYGVSYKGNNTSSLGYGVMSNKVTGDNYNSSFHAYTTGKLDLYVASNLIVYAGTYKLVLLCWGD